MMAGVLAGILPAGASAAQAATGAATAASSVRAAAASTMTRERVASQRAAAAVAAGSGGGLGAIRRSRAERGPQGRRPQISAMSSHSGLVTGAQVITIRGSNLSRAKAVHFGKLRAAILPGSTGRRLRVRTPASWAGTVRVRVSTAGGTTALSAADRFTFRNPARRSTSKVIASPHDLVANGSDVTAVTGGQASTNSKSASQTPWVVTLAAAAKVPVVGQGFLLKPSGSASRAGWQAW